MIAEDEEVVYGTCWDDEPLDIGRFFVREEPAEVEAAQATEVLQEGQKNKIIAEKNEQYVAIDIEEALNMKKHIDESMIETSKMLSL